MAIIELYIDNKLCDLNTDFGIRLNRQLINPAELNTKNAQFSFSIELPTSSTNNAILHYTHVEEAVNKFNRIYKAQLLVDSVMILDGNFLLTSISRMSYKGNLYIPAAKSISDIFGETKLNEVAPMPLGFTSVAASISAYNINAALEPQAAIFPYVLYGLLPKLPVEYNSNVYSSKFIWDDTVRMGIEDLPPSINPLKLIKHIFNSRGYVIEGSAFTDNRLTQLYMSYRNDPSYKQPWNYGHIGRIHVAGTWHSIFDQNLFPNEEVNKRPEKGIYFVDGLSNKDYYAVDLLDATNTKMVVVEDNGGNVINDRVPDNSGNTWTRGQITVPVSGLYKVTLQAQLRLYNVPPFNSVDIDPDTQVIHVSMESEAPNADASNYLNMPNKRYEIQVLRDKGTGSFNIENAKACNTLYYNNMPQPQDDDLQVPSYFPQPQNSEYAINLVDLAQSDKFLIGMSVGNDKDYQGGSIFRPNYYVGYNNYVLAAKPAYSWDSAFNDTEPTALAINNPGYKKYGILGQFDSPGENPNGPVDYASGTRVLDSILNIDGAPVADPSAVGWSILNRFTLQAGYTYRIEGGTGYNGYCYVYKNNETIPDQIIEFIGGIVEFNTATYLAQGVTPRVTFYLATDSFSVDGTLTITRIINSSNADAIGYENTNRYKIDLINAPVSRVRPGWYNDDPTNPLTDADSDVSVIVWLEAGERITVASVSQRGTWRDDGMHNTPGMVAHKVHFDLQIEPFRTDKEWIKVNTAGRGTAVMDWNDESNFNTSEIDLIQFLPNDIKVDDFIDNFCKAFNLKLSQSNENTFNLDVKQVKRTTSNQFIDLDKIVAVKDGVNTPIGLPTFYRIGFTVDTEEEGYVRTQDDGGGEFYTGAIEGNVVEQKSTFSYNWFKRINKLPENVPMDLPIISDNEPWVSTVNYGELMANRYFDKAFRFWYYEGLFSDLGITLTINGDIIEIARVTENIEGSILNYKNAQFTILDNYFTVLVSVDSHYVELEGYLTPIMYDQLDGTKSALYNGDLYYIAEVTGYDPQGLNKSKIKLIRRI